MRQVVFLVKRFGHNETEKWLTNYLVDKFANSDWQATVLLLNIEDEWANGKHVISDRITLFSFNIENSFLSLKGLIELKKALKYFRLIEFPHKIDLVVSFTIACVFFRFLEHVKKNYIVVNSLLVFWDFFPIHQYQIGRINNQLLSKVLYSKENREVNSFSHVGLMSNRNLDYFSEYHKNYSGKKFVLPLWSNNIDNEERKRNSPIHLFRKDKFNIVFGGKLVEGRGIHMLIELSKTYSEILRNINIVIVGKGKLSKDLVGHIRNKPSSILNYGGFLRKDEYWNLLKEADAGLVITVPNVTIPTFPSKVIDYSYFALPVIAAVERSTDFGSFVEMERKMGVSVVCDSLDKLAQTLKAFSLNCSKTLESYSINSKKTYDEVFHVSNAFKCISKNLGIDLQNNNNI